MAGSPERQRQIIVQTDKGAGEKTVGFGKKWNMISLPISLGVGAVGVATLNPALAGLGLGNAALDGGQIVAGGKIEKKIADNRKTRAIKEQYGEFVRVKDGKVVEDKKAMDKMRVERLPEAFNQIKGATVVDLNEVISKKEKAKHLPKGADIVTLKRAA